VGHFGCFCNLAIVNSAAINMCVQVPLYNLTHIPLHISLWVMSLDHMADLFLVFCGASILFLIVVVLIYIPTNSVWGFLLAPYFLLLFILVISFCSLLWFSERYPQFYFSNLSEFHISVVFIFINKDSFLFLNFYLFAFVLFLSSVLWIESRALSA
jgi:hypothetical protein